MESLKNIQFEKEHIVMEVQGGSKRDVIAQLLEPLLGAKGITEGLIEQFLEREAIDSTVLNENLAIPMARSRDCKRLAIVFGVNKVTKQIRFGEQDVKIVCLILIPHNIPTSHLPLLRELVELSTCEECVEAIMKYKTPGRILQRLRNY